MDERNLDADPIVQFRAWFDEAVTEGVREPDAMTVATAGSTGAPSARTVSLRGLDERGFAFYTNYRSPKARDLDENPRAAIVFHWREVERQVRAAGTAAGRPGGGWWAAGGTRRRGGGRGALPPPERGVAADGAKRELASEGAAPRSGDAPPLPEFWGGYVVTPVEVELWQGQPNR